jgi:hypothetical protein
MPIRNITNVINAYPLRGGQHLGYDNDSIVPLFFTIFVGHRAGRISCFIYDLSAIVNYIT